MAAVSWLGRLLWSSSPYMWQNLSKKSMEPVGCKVLIRQKITKARVPESVFQVRPGDHEKYGGDPNQPHKLHLITRIKSGKGRPYWEKDTLKELGLHKVSNLLKYEPIVHKNIPSVNRRLKMIKHLVRIQPLKLPHGIPTEEEMSDTYLNSSNELVIRRRLKPVEPKTIDAV